MEVLSISMSLLNWQNQFVQFMNLDFEIYILPDTIAYISRGFLLLKYYSSKELYEGFCKMARGVPSCVASK